MIALTPVLKSSNIDAMAYDAANHVLAVAFKPAGVVWHYREVPETVGEMMMGVLERANEVTESGMAIYEDDTPSVGRALAEMVKGKYHAEKIVEA